HLSLAGGLAQARLEADAITAWLGAGTGTAYAGTNLMANPTMQRPGPALPPNGYSADGFNGAAVDTHQVETIGGKTFYTVRAGRPGGTSDLKMWLPCALGALAGGDVIGCEFDFFFERQTGSAPSLTLFDARQEYVWGGGGVRHRAAHSVRASAATTPSLSG